MSEGYISERIPFSEGKIVGKQCRGCANRYRITCKEFLHSIGNFFLRSVRNAGNFRKSKNLFLIIETICTKEYTKHKGDLL